MIISRTPYRVSLIGGGTDFPEFFQDNPSLVISAAINKHFYLNITTRFDAQVRLSYTKTEIVREAGELQHDIARAILERYGLHSGLEIDMVGELPMEAGLGSSSSVTVGLLHAVRKHLGLECDATGLAEEAVLVETKLLGKPIGWQDQYGVAFPALKAITFGPGDAVQVDPIALSAANRQILEANALLVFTGKSRKAESVLSEQASRTDQNLAGLKAINGLANEMRAAFQAERLDLSLLGAVLNESWKIKQTFASSLSNSAIDELHKAGLAAGAWGGKLLGAGNGGFLLFLVPAERQPAMLSRMGNPRSLPLKMDLSGSSIIYNNLEGK